MTASIHIEYNDSDVRGTLTRLIALGRNPAPAMRDIATYGENSTRDRFRTETGPDGKRWKPSLRVQMRGGRTLTRDGHLGNSITSDSGRDFAEWGTNRIYAAINHFGGVIKPKHKKSLRFQITKGVWVNVKKVTITARPYMGVNGTDRAAILDILQRKINGAAHAG